MTRYCVTIGIIQHFSDGDTCQVNVEHTVAMESAHDDAHDDDDDIYAAVLADPDFMTHAVARAKEGDHVVLIGGECRIYPHHSLVRVSLELLGIERVEAPVVVGAFDM